MNRNLKGQILTTKELWEIADLTPEERDAVLMLHNDNLIHSRLLDITARRRFEMFMAGELELDTRFDAPRRTV